VIKIKRLIQANQQLFHLTNDEDFSYNPYYQNNQQEMGIGLYVTNKDSIRIWDNLLGGRKYVVPVNVSQLNVIKEENFPSSLNIQKDLIANGYTREDVLKNLPTGDTFGVDPMQIALKITWAKLNGFNAIEPYLDSSEGYQLVILDNANITFGNQIDISKF
jgi:hypothetical protein